MGKTLYFVPAEGLQHAYDDERLRLIGQIITDWNLCESVLEILAWQLSGLDYELGSCITTDLGNVSRIHLCQNTLNRFHSDESYYEPITKFLRLVDECRVARNAVAHFSIIADNTTFYAFSYTMKSGRGKISVKPAPIDGEELQFYSAAIGYALECLAEALHLLNDEPPPWRDNRLLDPFLTALKELRESRKPKDLD